MLSLRGKKTKSLERFKDSYPVSKTARLVLGPERESMLWRYCGAKAKVELTYEQIRTRAELVMGARDPQHHTDLLGRLHMYFFISFFTWATTSQSCLWNNLKDLHECSESPQGL